MRWYAGRGFDTMRGMRFGVLFAVALGFLLMLACGSSGDDTNCTNNGGVCVSSCSNSLPYDCGAGGTCCVAPSNDAGSGG
jgi:hypothetical protein